jgi:thiol-disulfide isomerase/thioredoxin
MMRLTRAESLAAVLGLGALALTPTATPAAGAKSLDPILHYPQWLDARPNAASLHGRVVLVDVFTFGCYNCANITPNLRTLHRTKPQSDLAIVGVHTPETPYERDRANVVTNLKRLGITWPVAIDNDSKLWNAYGVEYWPTQLIFDRSGKLRLTVAGDSQDAEVDSTINALIGES